MHITCELWAEKTIAFRLSCLIWYDCPVKALCSTKLLLFWYDCNYSIYFNVSLVIFSCFFLAVFVMDQWVYKCYPIWVITVICSAIYLGLQMNTILLIFCHWSLNLCGTETDKYLGFYPLRGIFWTPLQMMG